MMPYWELLILFFTVAMIYAAVGFGGGSSYLAILTFWGLPFKELRLIALLCNVIVVSGSFFIFYKNRQFNFKKILPLVFLSVPMAYLGAKMKIKEQHFFILLGITLIVSAVLLWIDKKIKNENEYTESSNIVRNASLGGAIGFLSGLVGIGGGIFLSPILNLLKWDSSRKIAATASLFILVNSLSGIVGQIGTFHENINIQRIIMLCIAVFIGGQIGSRLALKFNLLIIKRITAILVFVAGVEVLMKHF